MDLPSFLKYENKDLALAIVRMLLGATCMLHGGQKLFGWFGGSGAVGFLGYLQTMNVPTWLGYLSIFFEFFGGVLLLFGIAAELGALMIIPIMIAAIYLVHGNKGFFIQNGGYEYALNLLLLSLVVIIGGPGKFALWDVFQSWRI